MNKVVHPEILHNHFDLFDLRCPECGYRQEYIFRDEFDEYEGFRCPRCGATWSMKERKQG